MDPRNFIKKISWWQGVLVLALGALLLYGYLFFQRSNFSAQDVLVSIEGPETLKAQEEIQFEIRVQNNSKATLRDVTLIISLPEFMSHKEGEGLERVIELRPIAPKGEATHTIFVFAKETEREGSIKVRAEYSPENLAGTFESAATRNLAVSSLPLTVIFDMPGKAVSGQRILGSLHFVLENEIETLPLLAKVLVPDGFSLLDSEPLLGEGEHWVFDTLEVGKSYEAAFEGVITGEEGEVKTFDLVFGSENDRGELGVQYKISREVRLSSAPLLFEMSLNGKGDYAGEPGEKLAFVLQYGNKSGVDIEDITITAELPGDIFDLKSLDPGIGYFNPNSRTVIWNKSFTSQLSRLKKEEGGIFNFSVSIKESFSSSYNRGKGVSGVIKATIEAGKVPLSLKGLSLRAQREAKVKLKTSLELFTKAYYYEGPFPNMGPIPPRVGEKTTYTILWQVTNTFNEVNDVRVEVPLSRDVVFEQNIYPKGSNVTYNSAAHTVIWDIGALAAGVGSVYAVETAAFQISLMPKEEMRGKVVELIDQAKISGTDEYVGEFVEDVSEPLDTSLPHDAGIRQGDGVVR